MFWNRLTNAKEGTLIVANKKCYIYHYFITLINIRVFTCAICTLNIISIQKSGIFPFESLFSVIPQWICRAIMIMSIFPSHGWQRSRIVAIDTKCKCKQKISLPYSLTGLPNFGVIYLVSRVILYRINNQATYQLLAKNLIISFMTEI